MKTNYMHVVQQTDKEKLAMYMRLKKLELANMLVQCNKLLEAKVILPSSTTATGGWSVHTITFPTQASSTANESKGKKTRKANLAKQRQKGRRNNGKKRRPS